MCLQGLGDMTKIFTSVKAVKQFFCKYENYRETSKKSKLC